MSSYKKREREMSLIEEVLLSPLLRSFGEQRCKWKVLDHVPFQDNALFSLILQEGSFGCIENRTDLLC